MDDVLNKEECEHFIQISKASLTRARVSADSKGVISEGRSGSNTWIAHDYDKITLSVATRIATHVGMPLEHAEKFQIIHYDISQEYRSHYDSWDHNGSEKTMRCMRKGGARLRTGLVYLCDVEEGGGTKMTRLDIVVKPKQGRLLVFENCQRDSNEKHIDSLHEGMPVIKGEKFAFNLWFKECTRSMLYREFNPEYYEKWDQQQQQQR